MNANINNNIQIIFAICKWREYDPTSGIFMETGAVTVSSGQRELSNCITMTIHQDIIVTPSLCLSVACNHHHHYLVF